MFERFKFGSYRIDESSELAATKKTKTLTVLVKFSDNTNVKFGLDVSFVVVITHCAIPGSRRRTVTGEIPQNLICIIRLFSSAEKIQRLWITRQMLYSSGSHRARLFWTQVLQQWVRGELFVCSANIRYCARESINTYFKTVLISLCWFFLALAGSFQKRTEAMEQRAEELFTFDGRARVSSEILP